MNDMPAGAAGMPGMNSGFDRLAWVWIVSFVGVWALYFALRLSRRARGSWPWQRSILWSAGIVAVLVALTGPVEERAHSDFRMHMLAHLLLSMLAPIFLVLAAPVTLVLRASPPSLARWLVKPLMSRFARFVAHPATAATLNAGGLWALYTTHLFFETHRHVWLVALVHLHVLLAGYLFTAAIIGIDPIRHRPAWLTRALILIAALSAHAVLAKRLYAFPPTGVSVGQAHSASQLMYYGGDLIDAALITIFCWQWYCATGKSERRRAALRRLSSGGLDSEAA